jgi:predicted nucleotidyltransferase
MLAQQLFGSTRSAILAALHTRPEARLHIRELSRLTGSSPGTLHRELTALHTMGLLNREEVGRQVFYSANTAHPIFRELVGIFTKTAGVADVLAAALRPLERKVKAAFIYGSVAADEARPESDVDVMVIGTATLSEAVSALSTARERIGREINPTVMKPADFSKKLKARDGFIKQVWQSPRIWLVGDDGAIAESG